MSHVINRIGEKFGRLTIVKQDGRIHTKIAWLCKCDCGNETRQSYSNLKRGAVVSCGCKKKSGDSKRTHGESKTRLWRVWSSMKERTNCSPTHKDFKYYGHISLHEQWKDYLTFKKWALANGYTDDLTIERNNVNGNYEPSNCSFIPFSEQSKNKNESIVNRTTEKEREYIKNSKRTANSLALEFNISKSSVNRLKQGD